jgi:hypothetical protein
MTYSNWIKLLDDAPGIKEQFNRLIAVGFSVDNVIDDEKLLDLASDAYGGRAYPTTLRIVVRRRRVYEITQDARLDIVSGCVECGEEGEFRLIAVANLGPAAWEIVIDGILETDLEKQ